jgi:hypothetical protein
VLVGQLARVVRAGQEIPQDDEWFGGYLKSLRSSAKSEGFLESSVVGYLGELSRAKDYAAVAAAFFNVETLVAYYFLDNNPEEYYDKKRKKLNGFIGSLMIWKLPMKMKQYEDLLA